MNKDNTSVSEKSKKNSYKTRDYSYVFWNYLLHFIKNEEDAKSIEKHGFRLSQNPNIVSGLYTVPDVWYNNMPRRPNGYFKISTQPTCNVWDGNNDRPSDHLLGLGDLSYRKFYCETLNKIGYNIKLFKSDNNFLKENQADISLFFDSKEHRQIWAQELTEWLLDQKVDVYVNGGELIILNTEIIENIEFIHKGK